MAISRRQHDPEVVRHGLARWLRARHPSVASSLEVGPLHRPSSGLSSETFFAEVARSENGNATCASMVVRLPPAGDGLFPAYDLSLQALVQKRLEPTAVPVAAPVTLEEDPRWLGAPFVVMPRVQGRLLNTNPSFVREGWLKDSPPADQARLHERFLRTLATIHRLDYESLGLDSLRRQVAGGGGTTHLSPLAGELEWWSSYLDWASEGDPNPELQDAMRWCAQNRPQPEPAPALLWGDVQLVNAVFDDNLEPAAILDWEMCSIGPPEEDLGWLLAIHRMTVEVSGEDLPGFPSRDRTVAMYEQMLGRPTRDLDWFEAFALVRSGAILARIARLLGGERAGASWLTKSIPQLELLSELTGRRG